METWYVFRVTDCEWWFARTLEEAIADCKRQTGMEDDEYFQDARQVTEEELDTLTFTDDPEDPLAATRTFREELAARIELQVELEAHHGIERKPGLFASTEY